MADKLRKRNINPGDKVGIIAPGGQGAASNLPLIVSFIESLELIPVISEDIYDPSEPFYSNTDEFRARDLISSLLNDEIKLIWCIRGGTGCIRLIPYLEAELPDTLAQKLLIGFSDITALHLYFEHKYGWETMHGQTLNETVQNLQQEAPLQTLLDLIFGRVETTSLPTLTRLDETGGFEDGLQGAIVGGNLTLVEASIGTLWQVNPSGKILFLEETGEAAYRLERSLDHLKQTKVFESVSGVIFGDFDKSGSDALVTYVLDRFAKSVTFPVFRLYGIGHTGTNYPLPLNTLAEIKLIDFEQRTYSCTVSNISSSRF